jgi:DNA-binding transcriptional LysR family regulator
MNLRRLEYFTTLAQAGNLRRASELLNVSAPALSKAMRVLEEELEVELWTRDGRRSILTDSGKTLLRQAPILIADLKALKDTLQTGAARSSVVRIGTFEVFSTYFLSFLDKVKWNDVELELHELLPGEVERHIVSGALDIGITYMPVPDAQLDFLKVCSIEMGVYTRAGAFKGVAQHARSFTG